MGQCYSRITTSFKDELDDGINSFLWRINTTPPSYLFGTMHVPYTLVWDAVPENVQAAFNGSTHFYTEITAEDYCNDSDDYKFLPNGQQLSQVLPADVYLKLKQHVEHVREALEDWISPEQRLEGTNASQLFVKYFAEWERMRPYCANLLIRDINHNFIKYRQVQILDHFLEKSAKLQKKTVGGLETLNDRLRCFNKFGLEGQISHLNRTLNNLKRFGATSAFQASRDEGIALYREGRFKDLMCHKAGRPKGMLNEIFLKNNQTNVARAREKYVVQERSRQMGERILDILRTQGQGESHFFAAGAAHFAGRCRIQAIVRAAGYEVEHIGPEVALDGEVACRNGESANETVNRFGWLRAGRSLPKYVRF